MQVTVLAGRLVEAKAALDKLVRRAAKFGDVVSYKVGQAYVEQRTGALGHKYKVTVFPIDLEGVGINAGRFQFMAKLEFVNGEVMTNTVPGVEDLDRRFRTATNVCEHCNTIRRRNALYVVKELTTGKQIQVGHNCLRDFTGIDSPERVAAKFNWIHELKEWDEEHCGGRRLFEEELVEILAWSAVAIRAYGWMARSAVVEGEKCTSAMVSLMLNSLYWPHNEDEKKIIAKLKAMRKPEDNEMAFQAIDWVRSNQGDSDYIHNLVIACKEDLVTSAKLVGIIVSAMAAYQRDMEMLAKRRLANAEMQKSEYQGKVKDKLSELQVRVQSIRGYDSMYGYVRVYTFVDDNANLYVWKTSAGFEVNVGEMLSLKGTIKEHSEYKGVKQTVLTRVSLQSIRKEAA